MEEPSILKVFYAVALNPKTGAVLSMSGLKHDLKTGELTPDSLGTVTNVFVPGSVVKAATISSGWENGVLSRKPDLDRPVHCLPRFSSHQFLVYSGLRFIPYHSSPSSGVFIQYLYGPNSLGSYGANLPTQYVCRHQQARVSYGKLRSTFGEYGLGSATGIDLPDESTGFVPKEYSLLITLLMPLGSLITIRPCSWPSM